MEISTQITSTVVLFNFLNPKPLDSFFAATRPFQKNVWWFLGSTILAMAILLLLLNNFSCKFVFQLWLHMRGGLKEGPKKKTSYRFSNTSSS